MNKHICVAALSVASLFPVGISAQSETDLKAYSNYDFIPGEKILFEDLFTEAVDGEFPSRWKLIDRQGVINTVAGEKVFVFQDCSLGSMGKTEPRIKTKNYLTGSFTAEFDFFLPEEEEAIALALRDNAGEVRFISIQANEAIVRTNYFPFENDLTGRYKEMENLQGTWYHAAFACKNRQLKCYINESRVLVIPDCSFDPLSLFMMGTLNVRFKNFKLAEGGGMNMLDKILTDGRFVSRAIKFDVAKATIKGESMGFISELAKWLNTNPTVNLEIGGHTDSDGDNASNQKLSEMRAEAVKRALVGLGINASRLNAKGYGETVPVSSNDTPEGKADNRRVEFKKI